MRRMIQVLTLFLLLLLSTINCGHKKTNEQLVKEMFENKNDVTILVTDSGLGGLSVAADVASRLKDSGVFRNAKIVFFNALFHNKSGYNSLDSESEKVRIFDIALKSMKKKYDPDLLLIACNTLSVLYDKTDFSKKVDFPVIGIVKTGVDLMDEYFKSHPDHSVIIFATKTTIGAETHKKMLIKRGYAPEKIIGQACHRLAGAIERGTDSEETKGYIEKYVKKALTHVKAETPLFASLNCTHYGYAIDVFQEVFAENDYPGIHIIDPNPRMSDFMFQKPYLHRNDSTKVTVEVVSRVKISQKKKDSLDGLLRAVSPMTADALQSYTFDPDLFDPKFDLPGK
ncbi:hypothetical protein B6D60_05050 [candidate division KSB1 bacterium 4484_87]|nr:MAG: hypothetical protein B6D60_05050 [candidate division KSB1 bacterium 4484_87]